MNELSCNLGSAKTASSTLTLLNGAFVTLAFFPFGVSYPDPVPAFESYPEVSGVESSSIFFESDGRLPASSSSLAFLDDLDFWRGTMVTAGRGGTGAASSESDEEEEEDDEEEEDALRFLETTTAASATAA